VGQHLRNCGSTSAEFTAYVTSLPKSTIGKALGYSIERWSQLMIYASDGKLNIDNKPVENSIRPVAIGYAK